MPFGLSKSAPTTDPLSPTGPVRSAAEYGDAAPDRTDEPRPGDDARRTRRALEYTERAVPPLHWRGVTRCLMVLDDRSESHGYMTEVDFSVGYRLARAKRQRRAVRALVHQEPQRKGKGADRAAIAFRNDVREQLAWAKWEARESALLAVGLEFRTTRKQPAQLWNLPKNYLDLLGSSTAPAADPGPVLFHDDRSVKMLYASCDHDWGGTTEEEEEREISVPHIAISARTRADALSDMALAYRVAMKRNDGRGLIREDPNADDLIREDCRRELGTAETLRARGGPWLRTADLMTHRANQRWQELVLGGNDIWLRNAFFSEGRSLLMGVDREPRPAIPDADADAILAQMGFRLPTITTTRRATREMLLGGFVRTELPPLPTASGGTSEFKQGVSAAYAGFLDKYPDLFPLLVPLRVTVVVVPPRGSSKDLDNVILSLLAELDRQWRPPAAPWLLSPALEDPLPPGLEYTREWYIKERARRKTLGETAISSYQILELKRHRGDPARGALMLIPGDGSIHGSLWDEADRYLEEHFDA